MRKSLAVLCILTLVVSLFAGCGDATAPSAAAPDTVSGSGNQTAAPATASGEKATIRFSWWGGDNRHKAYLAAIELYTELNPNVAIEGEYQAWDGYQQKVWTQLASGAEADIIQLDAPWFPELSQKGDIFVDFNQQDIVDLSGFNDEFMRTFGEWDGKLIGIPAGTNSDTLLANKSAADEIGLDLTEFYENPYSFTRLKEVGSKLHEEHPDMYLVTLDLEFATDALVRARLKQITGKQVFNDDYTRGFTEEQLRECYQFMIDLYDSGACSPIEESQLYSGKIEQSPLWTNSKAIMAADWASAVSRYTGTLPEGKKVITLRCPTDPNGVDKNAQIVRPNFMFSVKQNSTYLEETLKFINWFFNDPDATLPLSDTRGINSTEVQRAAALEHGVANPESAKMVDIGKETMFPNENVLTTNTELHTLQQDEVAKVLYKELSPAEAAAETCKLIDEKLAELKQG